MKKVLLTVSMSALGIMTLMAPAAFAEDTMNVSANAQVQVGNTTTTPTRPSPKEVLQHERENLLKTNAGMKDRAAAFKQNIIDLKNAPLSEKKAFLVSSYNSADTFFNQRYDDFVVALNLASSRGADVTEARAHFAKAKDILVATKVHLQELSAMDASTVGTPTAKEVAKKVEAGYKQVRDEMHAGAVALKVAIQAKAGVKSTTTPPIIPPTPVVTQ